jgi:DNA-binding transcriptional LysR family regulator
MAKKSILSVDFAALRTLILVHETQSFTATAKSIEVNQSAVSYTIDKLRHVFEDPLFYRQGSKMLPTERCDEIVSAAKEMSKKMVDLATPRTFDPKTARTEFVISSNFYARRVLLPTFIRFIRKSAPGVRVDLITSGSRGGQQLTDGEADLMIGALRPSESGFVSRKLMEEHYVCIMDPENPLAKSPTFDRAAYLDAQHLAITSYDKNWQSTVVQRLQSENIELHQPVSSPSLSGLPHMIRGTDLVATVPSRLGQAIAGDLYVVNAPIPWTFPISLVWTEKTHDLPSHIWLRQKIFQIAKGLRKLE